MKDGRFQEGYKRLQKAIKGISDCVPFTSQMHEFAMAWSGTRGNKFYTDANALVTGIVKTAEDFDFDVPGLGYDVYNIEAEALGQKLVFSERFISSCASFSNLESSATKIKSVRKLYFHGRTHLVPFTHFQIL